MLDPPRFTADDERVEQPIHSWATHRQGEPSGMVHRDNKLDSHTPRMRPTLWDERITADLSRLALAA